MQKLESLKNAKFNSLSTDEMDKITGGAWHYRGTSWHTVDGVCESAIQSDRTNWLGETVERKITKD